MPNHNLNLHLWQVLAAKAGRLGAVLLPMKPQPPEGAECLVAVDSSGDVKFYTTPAAGVALGRTPWLRCPLGAPGDRVIGRECFAAIWPPEHPDGWTVDDDGTERGLRLSECNIEFRADGDPRRLPGQWPEGSGDDPDCPRWLPATHLPQEKCRWHWRNAGVRAVCLARDVTEEDATAVGLPVQMGDGTGPGSGLKWDGPGYWDCVSRYMGGATYHVAGANGVCRCYEGQRLNLTPARCAYRMLWDSINGKSHPWESNPWAWLVNLETTSQQPAAKACGLPGEEEPL